jgi:hypothetical protein
MKQNILVFGLIASAGLTFVQIPKANARIFGPSFGTSISEEGQKIAYSGTSEDCEKEDVKTGDKKKCE